MCSRSNAVGSSVCALVHSECLCCIDLCEEIRLDQCKEGKTGDNIEAAVIAKRMKETQNKPHINLRQEQRFI